MHIFVNHSNPVPLYYQIREQLRQQILSGELQPGDTLPSETQICIDTGVSRMTARQALIHLANEGLVFRQRGRGTFVTSPKMTFENIQAIGMSFTEMLNQLGMTAGSRVLAQEILPASQEVANQLHLAPGAKVINIVRTRLVSGEVTSLEIGYYPFERFPGLETTSLINASLHRTLEKQYGIKPAYALDTIEISVAGIDEAVRLEVHEGAPIVMVTTVTFLDDDSPIAYTQTILRGDRFRSVIRRSSQQLG